MKDCRLEQTAIPLLSNRFDQITRSEFHRVPVPAYLRGLSLGEQF